MGVSAKLNKTIQAKKQALSRARSSKSRIGQSDPLTYTTTSGETKATIITSTAGGRQVSTSYDTVNVDGKDVPVSPEVKAQVEKQQLLQQQREQRAENIQELADRQNRPVTPEEVAAIRGGIAGQQDAEQYRQQIAQAKEEQITQVQSQLSPHFPGGVSTGFAKKYMEQNPQIQEIRKQDFEKVTGLTGLSLEDRNLVSENWAGVSNILERQKKSQTITALQEQGIPGKIAAEAIKFNDWLTTKQETELPKIKEAYLELESKTSNLLYPDAKTK